MVHAKDGVYMEVELFGKPALFSNYRIDTVSVPKGLYCYDLRGSDDDPGMPIAVEPLVVVNHAGTVLTVEPIALDDTLNRREIDTDNGLNFTGGNIELKDFCEKHGIAYSETKYALRPASQEETGLFYAMPPEKDAELGCIGHVRIDFGHGGNEFWHTWWPRGPQELNSYDFQDELTEVVDELRGTVLSNMTGMRRFCTDHGGYMDGGYAPNYGYVIETKDYKYCLRCIPMSGDYNAYLTAYSKRAQKQYAEQHPVGRVSFTNGDRQCFGDAASYLKCIKEELEFMNITGFRFETVTDDPAVRKAVDDMVYNLYGEENPRPLEDYEQKEETPDMGMTMGGM